MAGGDDGFGLFGFGDEANGCGEDVGFIADGCRKGNLEVWLGIDLGVVDGTAG